MIPPMFIMRRDGFNTSRYAPDEQYFLVTPVAYLDDVRGVNIHPDREDVDGFVVILNILEPHVLLLEHAGMVDRAVQPILDFDNIAARDHADSLIRIR